MQQQLTDRQILTVSDLNRNVKKLLESHFKLAWIEGEISNLSKPQSGHIYFTLKDEQAQVRCALFRLKNQSLPFELENGMQVLVCAKISLYEGRGDYQLIIEHLEELGEGLLRRRFEVLKNKLAAEGLFDSSHKQAIPKFPKCIGVVTSPTGAAIRDVLSVLKRRFAAIPIIIYPSAVQGDAAANQIANAIQLANSRKECDVLIVCRGGGSLEDLWSFNEEVVARAIFNSDLPIVSGVGHEIDFTIADFVADQRAATPSAAAEMLSPDKVELWQRVTEITSRLSQSMILLIKHHKISLDSHRQRLVQPKQHLQQLYQSIDFIEMALKTSFNNKIKTETQQLQLLTLKLHHLNPKKQLEQQKQLLNNNIRLLANHVVNKINDAKQQLQGMSRTLNTVSPLNTLERGYSIAIKEERVVEDISQVKPGDALKIIVKSGKLFCTVNKCE